MRLPPHFHSVVPHTSYPIRAYYEEYVSGSSNATEPIRRNWGKTNKQRKKCSNSNTKFMYNEIIECWLWLPCVGIPRAQLLRHQQLTEHLLWHNVLPRLTAVDQIQLVPISFPLLLFRIRDTLAFEKQKKVLLWIITIFDSYILNTNVFHQFERIFRCKATIHILSMLMRVGAGVVVVVTTIAAGQQTICLRPIDPHIVG